MAWSLEVRHLDVKNMDVMWLYKRSIYTIRMSKRITQYLNKEYRNWKKKPVNDYCIKILCQEFFYKSSDSISNRRFHQSPLIHNYIFEMRETCMKHYFGFRACHRESYQTALAEKRLFSSVFLYVIHFRFNLSMAITLVHSAHWMCDIACAVKKV